MEYRNRAMIFKKLEVGIMILFLYIYPKAC